MYQVRCENKRYDNKGKLIKCNKLLACFPDTVVEALFLNEGEKIIVSCHSCRGNRFAEISVKDKKICFKATNKMDLGKYKQLQFDDIKNVEEVKMEG
jgi:hypothetical protein